MTRTVEQWKTILDGAFPRAAAKIILGELAGYRSQGPHEETDIIELGNAVQALVSLAQDSS